MKIHVIITTINHKTPPILKFEQLKNCAVILVGDVKTPHIEESSTLSVIPYEEQLGSGFKISAGLPKNHYTRKNIGYLQALKTGATVIYDTDDDNCPYDDWSILDFQNDVEVKTNQYFNVYSYFSSQHIWPRGLPLDEIHSTQYTLRTNTSTIGVWQGLADKDPDVDAIYRLTNGAECVFNQNQPIHLSKYSYCPFNSQNTTWNINLFPLMYLPCTVSFRFTDILRGYIAQRVMWEYGYHLGFHKATVYQERNEHSLMKDFNDEIVCYTRIKELVNILDSLSLGNGMNRDMITVYKVLEQNGFTSPKEVQILTTWLKDIEDIENAKN